MKEKKPKKKMTKMKRNLYIFLGMTVILFGLMIGLTIGKKAADGKAVFETVQFNYYYIFILLGLWFVSYSADSIALKFFVKGTGERLSLLNSYKITSLKVYFNVITPFTGGGQPMMVYAMNTYKIPPGKGSNIVLTKLMTVAIFNFLCAMTSIIFFKSQITANRTLNIILFASAIFFSVTLTAGVVALLSKRFQHGFGKFITWIGSKIRLVKNPQKTLDFINKEAEQTRKSFRQYFSRKGIIYFLLGCFFNLVLYCSHVSIMLVILKGFNVEIGIMEALVKSAVLIFTLSFVPLPAGLGGGEVSYSLIFGKVIMTQLLGIVVLIWRLILQFFTAIVGGIVTAVYFSELTKDKEECETPLDCAKELLEESEIKGDINEQVD
jgi:uncharacterized protein (TIRG00374 family)